MGGNCCPKNPWNHVMVHDEMHSEECREIVIWLVKYRWACEISQAPVEIWTFAEQRGRGYCSAVSSPKDKGVRDIVDSSAVPPGRILEDQLCIQSVWRGPCDRTASRYLLAVSVYCALSVRFFNLHDMNSNTP